MTVPPGPILADALISSAVIAGEDGAPSSNEGLFDPANDPELALVSTISFNKFFFFYK